MKILISVVTVLALNVAVFGGIAGTAHDFSASGWSQGEICLPCHTPHSSDATIGFLWNHAYPDDAAFTKVAGATLEKESLACLGCHDGQTALDSVGGQAGSTVMTGDGVIGTDLTDDHPVGVEYGTSTRYAAVGTIWGSHPGIPVGFSGLPLYGADNTIECTTCHTPHSNANDNFLRLSNAGSALCIACHISW